MNLEDTLNIRIATSTDLPEIERVYATARETMRANGNTTQWTNGYPQRELLEEDIARECLYVVEKDIVNGADGGANSAVDGEADGDTDNNARNNMCDTVSVGTNDQNSIICGVFYFATEDDPTYEVIEGGAWCNDEPYGVIHRIASDGSTKGVFAAALAFAEQCTHDIRIDTHEHNTIMQHILESHGFERCGIIYCHDSTPRIAFHKVVSN